MDKNIIRRLAGLERVDESGALTSIPLDEKKLFKALKKANIDLSDMVMRNSDKEFVKGETITSVSITVNKRRK